MKKENDELINLFRTRLEDAEMQVRKGFWQDLERDIPVVLNRRKQIIHRMTAAASVAILLGGASAAFWFYSPKEEISKAFTQAAVSTGNQGTLGLDVVKEEFPSITATTVLPTPALKPAKSLREVADEEDDDLSFSFSMTFTFSSSITPEGKNEEDLLSYGNRTNYLKESTTAAPTPVVTKKKEHSWSTKVYASSNPITEKGREEGLRMFTSKGNNVSLVDNTGEEASAADFPSEDDYENYLKVLNANNITLPMYTSFKHKIPISVGLTVSKRVLRRVSVEAGVVYTQLNSELMAGAESYFEQEQKLHYLGIPLKINVDLFDSKKFDLYASAGGILEKCIAGNVRTNYVVNGENTYSSKHSLTPDPVQFSLTAGLGLQYNITDRLSLYAEPGITYAFDDGSAVSTLRKEKPFNFNLLCGMRMTY